MNEESLTRLRRPPRAAFSAALYQRISKPMLTPTQPPRWRRLALALGTASLALVLTLAAMPPARAWATTVLRQIGVLQLVEEASPRTEAPDTSEPLPTGTPIPADRPARLTTVEQVAAEAGFQPLQPATLPEGYTLTELGVMEYIDDSLRPDGLGTFLHYTPAASEAFLDVQQSRFYGDAPREVAIGDVPVVDVTVRGVPGVWLAGLPGVHPGERLNMLLWWEDGFAFALQSNVLGLEEVLPIAESLEL